MMPRPSRHVQFAYFLEKTSDAARVTAQDMLCVAALDLVAGMHSALLDTADSWTEPDRARTHADKIERLRSNAFGYLPVDADGKLALGPSDMRWYKRTAQRLRKILKSQWGDNVDARELVMAAMLMCEEARSALPKWKVDSRLLWGRLCEAIQELYEEYDPELDTLEAMDKGTAVGEAMARCVFK